MRSAVRNVAKYFPTAIISGRSRDKVAKGSFIEEFLFCPSIYLYAYHLDTISVLILCILFRFIIW
jgi:hypothetical protein